MKCKICGNEFEPEDGQLPAWWAVSWCDTDKGVLCPPCHVVAEEKGAVGKKMPTIMRALPWGSDIAEASKAVTKEAYSDRRRSESFYRWNATHNPDVYTEEERALILT